MGVTSTDNELTDAAPDTHVHDLHEGRYGLSQKEYFDHSFLRKVTEFDATR